MPPSRLIYGEVRERPPNWRPLKLFLGSYNLCGGFMWMFGVELQDGTVLDVYKHRWTRCYLHLSADARTFYYAGGERYGTIEPLTLVMSVFENWEGSEPTPPERSALSALLDRLAGEAES